MKQDLQSESDKRMETGAKILKGGLGLLFSFALVLKNKDNLKVLGKGTKEAIGKLIKK